MTGAAKRVQLNIRVPETLRDRLRERATEAEHPGGLNGWLLDHLNDIAGGTQGGTDALTASSPTITPPSPSEGSSERPCVEQPDEDGLISIDAALASAAR
jgi:hypothetical protein